MPGDRASAALLVFALAEAAHVVAPLGAAVVVPSEPVAGALADPAHVASAVVVADDLHAVLVDSAPVLVHDAFVVVAAAVEQLRVVAVVAVAGVLVLRLVRPAAAVVVQVARRVQLAAHVANVLFVAAPSVVVAVVAQRAAVRAAHSLGHAAVEQAGPAAEQPVVVLFVLAVHRVRDARLSPGTSDPSHARVQYSRAGPSPDSAGMAALPVLCS